MKRLLFSVAGVLTMSAALAVPAQAQTESFNFDNYCVTGSYMVCASVRLKSVDNHLTMQVWNLDNTLGLEHTMTAVGLYHTTTEWTGTVSGSMVQYLKHDGTADDITSYWKNKGAQDIGTLGSISTELKDGTSGGDGIVGCDDSSGGTHWATCWNGGSSFSGLPYVQFDFDLSSHFALSNVQLRWHSQQLTDGNSLKCDTGGAGDYPACVPQTTVPEPASMTLMATGLLGMAGFVRRRRKNTEVDA